jgi:predicted signal transduction protein with EAL and GGDEF domain
MDEETLMRSKNLSMRASLGLTVIVMGLIAMALVIMTGAIYRTAAIESHRSALVDLVKLKTSDLLALSRTRLTELALAVQHSAELGRLISDGDAGPLQQALDSQFHQYFVTAGITQLEKLYAYDSNFRLAARSQEGARGVEDLDVVCPGLLAAARQRKGAERLQVASALCSRDGVAYQAVLVPVGGLRVAGYLVALANGAFSLREMEAALGMPLAIYAANDASLYQSQNWPDGERPYNSLLVEYSAEDSRHQPALRIAVVADVTPFYLGLARSRNVALLIAGFATVVAGLIALRLLRRTTLLPLQTLTQQLQLLREDKRHLGEHVSVGGNREIRQLATNFNKMTSELRTLYRRLETLAFTDPVTRLANRARFHDLLQLHCDSTHNNESPFALMIIDVDRFKAVNDSLGHEVGDQLLAQLGARIENVLRKSDITTRLDRQTIQMLADNGHAVARLGGDEFAVLLPQLSGVDQARVVAEKLLAVMKQPFVLHGNSFDIRVSVGIVMSPEHGNDAGTLLRRADVAVTESKKAETGYHIYNSNDGQHRLFQLTLERELRHAIESDGLQLHYQPQLVIETGAVHGVEALLRWNHPQRGFIRPDEFIPLAEQSGLIHPLTEWVLKEALAFCGRMRAQGITLNVAVNLSARSLQARELTRVVKDALLDANVPADLLALEITESAVMADPNRAFAVLTEFDCMGVALSIDDFGTGYSSMAYLKRLPVDEIKIDRSFVMEMKEGSNDLVIVRAIVELAHNLGLRAVAEGVETEANWNMLHALGCDLAQGYYMARPLPEAKLVDWIHKDAVSFAARLTQQAAG